MEIIFSIIWITLVVIFIYWLCRKSYIALLGNGFSMKPFLYSTDRMLDKLFINKLPKFLKIVFAFSISFFKPLVARTSSSFVKSIVFLFKAATFPFWFPSVFLKHFIFNTTTPERKIRIEERKEKSHKRKEQFDRATKDWLLNFHRSIRWIPASVFFLGRYLLVKPIFFIFKLFYDVPHFFLFRTMLTFESIHYKSQIKQADIRAEKQRKLDIEMSRQQIIADNIRLNEEKKHERNLISEINRVYDID